MPDPFRKVSPGESVIIPSVLWNAFLDVSLAEKLRKYSRTSESSERVRQGTIIRILNASGLDLVRNSVLGLSTPIFPPSSSEEAFQNEVTFRGVIPTAAHKGKFAITLDPIPVDGIGRAHVDGVTPVKIDILDTSHSCCDVDPGDTTHLVSMPSGASAQILWSEGTGTVGEQWGIVRIASPSCVVACGTIVVTVRKCLDNSLISGALVTVKDGSGATVGSDTTGVSGVVTIPIPSAATYSVIVSKTGEVTATVSIAATCTANNVTIKLGGTLTATVSGCGCGLPGATVLVTQTAGGSYTASGVTNSAGQVVLWLPVASGAAFSYNISAPLYQSATVSSGTLTGTVCAQVVSRILATVPGYMCYGGNPPFCRDPIPPSVILTIAGGGSHTLPYIGESSGVGGYGYELCIGTRIYTYFASNQYVPGSSGGCNVPGAILRILTFNGPGCTGGLLGSPAFPVKTAGTGACPIAATFAGGYTVSQ